MSSFNRILREVREADAKEQTSKTIQAALTSSELESRVLAAQAHFENIGIHSFLSQEAEAMRAERFWCQSSAEGVPGRASASIAFVPCAGEDLNNDQMFGPLNEYTLIIQAFAGGDVDCRFCARAGIEYFARDLPLNQLTLPLVQEWYERFVRLAFEKRKQSDSK